MNDKTFVNADVWLMLLREGGRWTAAEIAQRVGMDQTAAANNLRRMEEFGTIKRWEREDKQGGRVRYGVTPECKVPRGLKVCDVMGILGGEQ